MRHCCRWFCDPNSLIIATSCEAEVNVHCQESSSTVLLFAGHHTIYIGVHVPKSYRRRRRHRRRASHKDKKERLTENTSDKSDTENNDEASNSILKPLSKFWWTPCQGLLEPVSVFPEGFSPFQKKGPVTHCDPTEVAESTKWLEITTRVLWVTSLLGQSRANFHWK